MSTPARCPKCGHSAHNQHDCIFCTCDQQKGMTVDEQRHTLLVADLLGVCEAQIERRTPSGDAAIKRTADAILAELARMEGSVKFTRDWYGQRWAKLRELFDGTAFEKPACDIMANGLTLTPPAATEESPAPTEPPPPASSPATA